MATVSVNASNPDVRALVGRTHEALVRLELVELANAKLDLREVDRLLQGVDPEALRDLVATFAFIETILDLADRFVVAGSAVKRRS